MTTGINWSIKNRILVNGKALSEARIRMGKSLEDVGNSLGCNKGTVCKWETGKLVPSEERIYAMVELFGTSDFIVGNQSYNKRKHPAWNKGLKRNSQVEKLEGQG